MDEWRVMFLCDKHLFPDPHSIQYATFFHVPAGFHYSQRSSLLGAAKTQTATGPPSRRGHKQLIPRILIHQQS